MHFAFSGGQGGKRDGHLQSRRGAAIQCDGKVLCNLACANTGDADIIARAVSVSKACFCIIVSPFMAR